MLNEHVISAFASTYHHHGVLVNGQNLICNDSQIDNCVKACAKYFAPMDQQACVAAVELKWAPYSKCFSGDACVIVKGNMRPVRMRELQVGDLVLDHSLSYTRVVGWLHFSEVALSPFAVLDHECGQIVVSGDHLLYCTVQHAYVPAHSVVALESLYIDGSFVPSRVLRTETKLQTGFFAPLTESGTLLVDGIRASCYASPNQLHFPVSQTIANLALLPYRLSTRLSKVVPIDTYCRSLYHLFSIG